MTVGELANALNKLPGGWKEQRKDSVTMFVWGSVITMSMLGFDTIQYIDGEWVKLNDS